MKPFLAALLALGISSAQAQTLPNPSFGSVSISGYLTTNGLPILNYNTAIHNLFVGGVPASAATTGNGGNTFMGGLAGGTLTTGYYNTALGYRAAATITGGINDTIVGTGAGTGVTTGTNMTIIGGQVAPTCATGNMILLIGTTGASVDCPSAGASNWFSLGNAFMGNLVKPTIGSGFGASPSVVNGTSSAAFTVNVGTGGAATTGVVSFPTAAPHGWACTAVDGTNPATSETVAVPGSTTTITLANYSRVTGTATAWAAGDVITVSCNGY